MFQGRCMKCKKQVDIKDGVENKTTRGVKIIKGICPVCSTKVCRLLGK